MSGACDADLIRILIEKGAKVNDAASKVYEIYLKHLQYF